MKAKRKIMVGVMCLLLVTTPARPAETAVAFPIIGLIKIAAKKVIKAMDLRIQRLQNKTIWLQNAQKKIENILSKIKLDEISEWTAKQRDLYRDYYDELMKVKSIISSYQLIKDVSQKQVKLVTEYEKAWKLFQQDRHFNADELEHMRKVYSGILNESMNNIDQIFLILDSYTTQMSDAKRIEIITEVANQIDATYNDLSLFNKQNILLSIQRAKTQQDVDAVKKLYSTIK